MSVPGSPKFPVQVYIGSGAYRTFITGTVPAALTLLTIESITAKSHGCFVPPPSRTLPATLNGSTTLPKPPSVPAWMRTICGASVFNRVCTLGVPSIVGHKHCVESVVLTVPVTVAASTVSVAVVAAAAGCVIDQDAAMLATSVMTATAMGRPRPCERGRSSSIRTAERTGRRNATPRTHLRAVGTVVLNRGTQ